MRFTRPKLRRISRWLLASVMFTLLHPVLAMGVASPGGAGDRVQVCTGVGMVWLRIDGATALAPSDLTPAGRNADSGSMATRGDAVQSASQCPLCAAVAILSECPAGEGPRSPWPALTRAKPPGPNCLAPASERLILDAPTRGPPRSLRLA